MKILVIDDDPDITSLYKASLEGHEGFEVETFNDPRKAYQISNHIIMVFQ
jgi:DNA-binding response OmpR family regulator